MSNQPELHRLQKIVAQRHGCSRRAAEALIIEGRVEVEGKVAQIGMQVPENVILTVDGHTLGGIERTVTYIVNKPRGVVCSLRQQGKSKLITDYVPASPRVVPIGRLDKESDGLILLSNDGDLQQRLTHPSFLVRKHYRVVIRWKEKTPEPSPEQLEKQLMSGTKLSDGKVQPDSVDVRVSKTGDRWLSITLHDGRHHVIRRMCATRGYDVRRLRRTGIGKLTLKGLESGTYRIASKQELSFLIK